MSKKILGLREDGTFSYCSSLPENRGKRNCPHKAHQIEGESVSEFIERANKIILEEAEQNLDNMPNQQEFINKIIKENKRSFNNNPDWDDYIRNNIPNYFTIGKKSDGSYEQANIINIDQQSVLNEDGDPVIRLTMNLEFRGSKYSVDMGEIPEIQEDGTIIINGSSFRCLPVLSQFKKGLISYRENIVFQNENGHVSMSINKETKEAKIGGVITPIEEIEKYLKGEEANLSESQKWHLDNIDPIVEERFPNYKENLLALTELPPDIPNDIEYRKVLTYEDQVGLVLSKQMRRMGVTFRSALVRRKEAEDSGDPKLIEKAEKYPLFYQRNISDNIKEDLTGRSNVQLAEDLNPLAALSQSAKISLTGPGGYNKDKAPITLRFISRSYKGKIDTMDMSSGKNTGLTISLSNAEVNSKGFIVPLKEGSKLAVSDFIPFKYHNDANRATMAVAHMKQACPIAGGEDPKKIGDSSDKAWEKISGAKIGVNLKVAYIPHKGCHEDSVVISESAARKMLTRQTTSYKRKGKDSFGQAQVGREVKCGDIIDGVKIKYNGVIVESNDKVIKVQSDFAMGVGDKIAGRHGNKGTVSMVLPDSEMPKIRQEDGSMQSAEILMSPLSVTGRMNIGQVLETNDGDLNKRSKIKLESGNTVEGTAGTQYIMRLNHIAEKKLQSYSVEFDAKRNPKGLRLGEMESLLLSSSPDRIEVLNYLRNQESSDAQNKLTSLLKSVGVEIKKND